MDPRRVAQVVRALAGRHAAPVRLLLGTDAASEGLNLQRLSTLINLDLPWNPTRLEQRKGRIQRIGQLSDIVLVYNMRYLDSVEARVHQLLSSRLQEIFTLFGQVPDVLQDVWIDVALGEVERAKQVIAAVPKQHPFDIKYQKIERIDPHATLRSRRAVAGLALFQKDRRDLLEIMDARHGRAATIVTSQLPVDAWHAAIGDPTLADAILDRLVHNAHRLTLKGDSMRKTAAKMTALDHSATA